jgi:hypothetical protein
LVAVMFQVFVELGPASVFVPPPLMVRGLAKPVVTWKVSLPAPPVMVAGVEVPWMVYLQRWCRL